MSIFANPLIQFFSQHDLTIFMICILCLFITLLITLWLFNNSHNIIAISISQGAMILAISGVILSVVAELHTKYVVKQYQSQIITTKQYQVNKIKKLDDYYFLKLDNGQTVKFKAQTLDNGLLSNKKSNLTRTYNENSNRHIKSSYTKVIYHQDRAKRINKLHYTSITKNNYTDYQLADKLKLITNINF